jgi:hypothetical protein
MKRKVFEKAIDKISGAGEKSGGIFGLFTKNIFITLISVIGLLIIGFIVFISCFGKAFHKKITKPIDPHLSI